VRAGERSSHGRSVRDITGHQLGAIWEASGVRLGRAHNCAHAVPQSGAAVHGGVAGATARAKDDNQRHSLRHKRSGAQRLCSQAERA